MGVYQFSLNQEQANLKLQEQHIYGSARLGVVKPDLEMIGTVDPSDVGEFDRVRGMKRYELSNHLGNVLTVISDRKIATVDNGVNIYFHAEIISYTDYYPFGAPMSQGTTDRTWSVEEYRFGFNGKEQVDEMIGESNGYDFGARMYDARLGRWWSVDQLFDKYPYANPYNFTLNSPVLFIDPDGKVVTIKDKASARAVLNTLSSKELKRVIIKKDGTLKIRGKREGSGNLEALRQLVNSDRNYNVLTSMTYESKEGTVNLPTTTSGRTVVPDFSSPRLSSPDNDIYVVIKPTSDEGAAEVAAHELLGHAYLYDLYEDGDKSKFPWHLYNDKTKKDENINTTSGHLWPRVSEARKNYDEGKGDKKREIRLKRQEKKFERITKKNEQKSK